MIASSSLLGSIMYIKKKRQHKSLSSAPKKPSPRLYSPNPWMVSRLKSPVYQDPLAQVKLPGASR